MGIRGKVTSFFKKKIISTVRESGYTFTYFPFNRSVNEYVIPKSKKKYPQSEDGLPIPPADLRVGYPSDDDKYLQAGKIDIDNMTAILNSAGVELSQGKRILDFGCSSGRMIRHLKKYAETNEIWGTDVRGDEIYWCNKYLNPPFQFLISTLNAHLPFEDKYFDLIYSGSVFTHIDNLIETWLLELRRVLSKGGLLYVTIHDNHSLELFEKSKEISLGKYLRSIPFYESAKKDFDFFVLNRAKSPQVFFDIDYFKKLIRPSFEIVSVNEEAYGYQTGVLLRRKD